MSTSFRSGKTPRVFKNFTMKAVVIRSDLFSELDNSASVSVMRSKISAEGSVSSNI